MGIIGDFVHHGRFAMTRNTVNNGRQNSIVGDYAALIRHGRAILRDPKPFSRNKTWLRGILWRTARATYIGGWPRSCVRMTGKSLFWSKYNITFGCSYYSYVWLSYNFFKFGDLVWFKMLYLTNILRSVFLRRSSVGSCYENRSVNKQWLK